MPAGSVDYLRMNLDLSPNEYMNTSRDVYEQAMAYQNSRVQGAEAAKEEHRKEQEKARERERKQQESEARVHAKAGH